MLLLVAVEVVAKNGPEKKAEQGAEYLTDSSFDKANSTVLSGERYLSLLQTE